MKSFSNTFYMHFNSIYCRIIHNFICMHVCTLCARGTVKELFGGRWKIWVKCKFLRFLVVVVVGPLQYNFTTCYLWLFLFFNFFRLIYFFEKKLEKQAKLSNIIIIASNIGYSNWKKIGKFINWKMFLVFWLPETNEFWYWRLIELNLTGDLWQFMFYFGYLLEILLERKRKWLYFLEGFLHIFWCSARFIEIWGKGGILGRHRGLLSVQTLKILGDF